MRIVLMLFIIAHHSVVNSGLLDCLTAAAPDLKSTFVWVWGMWGKTAINPFVMIAGYFMCTSRLTWIRFLKLIGEVLFYKAIIDVLFVAGGLMTFTGAVQHVSHALLFVSANNDFVASFMVLYLSIPFLNALINHINRRQMLALICLCLWVEMVLPSFFGSSTAFTEIAWYCTLYLIAAYLRLHAPKWSTNHALCSCLLLVSIVLAVASVVIHAGTYAKAGSVYFWVADSGKVLAFTTGLFCFCWFNTLKLGYHKSINTISATAFGVLLIHANSSVMRLWLWQTVLQVPALYQWDTPLFALYLVVLPFAIYAVCAGIDYLRIRFVEKPLFGVLTSHKEEIEQHVMGLVGRIKRAPAAVGKLRR